jgi:hypothetical protein
VIVKVASIRVRARVMEFGLGALSSHAASQSRPSTISGVPEVREGGIITAMGVTYGRNIFNCHFKIVLSIMIIHFI